MPVQRSNQNEKTEKRSERTKDVPKRWDFCVENSPICICGAKTTAEWNAIIHKTTGEYFR